MSIRLCATGIAATCRKARSEFRWQRWSQYCYCVRDFMLGGTRRRRACPRIVGIAELRVRRGSVVVPVKSSAGAQVPQLNVTTSTGPDGVNRVVLSLSATEKTWLSITADGKKIFSGVLEPSQTKTLAGSDVATMKVGNAGGIEVLWNGKSIGPIGPRGQVREVMFTPDNFEIKQPIKPL